ncbi:hypothetical protein LIER_23415 [Lithospermum erythrorhizon]|uniref:Uncharacterized protein n=1 Tax=Lithospermum erythrorhizon TaxID=34254 RepID=A0AAV3QXL8_LITER
MSSTTTSYCTSSFLSSPSPPPQKSLLVSTRPLNLIFKDKTCSKLSISSHIRNSSRTVIHIPCSSTSSTPTIEEDKQVVESSELDELPLDSEQDFISSLSSMGGCKACGRAEIERGCNGEGRIQGGIATVPGFGWWPIKAYRPCPGFTASGGRYRRTGQSMDEVVSGRGERQASVETDAKGKSRKKKQGPSRLKK